MKEKFSSKKKNGHTSKKTVIEKKTYDKIF